MHPTWTPRPTSSVTHWRTLNLVSAVQRPPKFLKHTRYLLWSRRPFGRCRQIQLQNINSVNLNVNCVSARMEVAYLRACYSGTSSAGIPSACFSLLVVSREWQKNRKTTCWPQLRVYGMEKRMETNYWGDIEATTEIPSCFPYQQPVGFTLQGSKVPRIHDGRFIGHVT